MGNHRAPRAHLAWVGDWLAYMLLRVLLISLLLVAAATFIVGVFVVTGWVVITLLERYTGN